MKQIGNTFPIALFILIGSQLLLFIYPAYINTIKINWFYEFILHYAPVIMIKPDFSNISYRKDTFVWGKGNDLVSLPYLARIKLRENNDFEDEEERNDYFFAKNIYDKYCLCKSLTLFKFHIWYSLQSTKLLSAFVSYFFLLKLLFMPNY
jgi:hypothetical protein